MPSPAGARQIALSVLSKVSQEGAYANLALPAALNQSGLSQRDRALVTELVYGSLRASGELDVVISKASSRELEKLEPMVRDILRLGIYQILVLRVPDHATLDQSARLAKTEGLHRAVGFINAVLRSVTSRPVDYWEAVITDNTQTVLSHPMWIADEYRAALAQSDGEGEMDLALASHNEPPPVTFVHLPGFSKASGETERTRWSPLGSYAPAGDPGKDPRLAKGSIRVQDEGSQLAALMLSGAKPLVTGERILDMCAGPGGKTAVLAAAAQVAGAHVVAYEIAPHRAALVRTSISAISAKDPRTVEVLVGDACEIDSESGGYDRVLLDAPCSGLGALRRRPEARWRKSPDDIPALVALQQRLLGAALDLVKPGGIVAYVTCSPVIRETTGVVSTVLQGRPDVITLDSSPILDSIASEPVTRARRGTAVQLWSHRHATDAMFVQILQRIDSPGDAR